MLCSSPSSGPESASLTEAAAWVWWLGATEAVNMLQRIFSDYGQFNRNGQKSGTETWHWCSYFSCLLFHGFILPVWACTWSCKEVSQEQIFALLCLPICWKRGEGRLMIRSQASARSLLTFLSQGWTYFFADLVPGELPGEDLWPQVATPGHLAEIAASLMAPC